MEQEVVIDSTKKLRLDYLRQANVIMREARLEKNATYLNVVEQIINDYLKTIKELHPASNEIQTSFDESIKTREKTMGEMENDTNNQIKDQKINTWEQRNIMNNAEIDLTIKMYDDRLESLWQISLKHALVPE